MPIVVQYTTNVSAAEYDEIFSRIRIHDDPPEGLMVHTAAVNQEGQIRVFDVWRSLESHDRFAENRLRPAIAEVVGREYADDGSRMEMHELHSLLTPGWSPGSRRPPAGLFDSQ
jgi:hypothetical protein